MALPHMPSSNKGTKQVPLGTTRGGSIMASSGKTVGTKHPSKSNMPASNKGTKSVKLGTTSHKVGCSGVGCNC